MRRVGLTLGKFAPLHHGHQGMIRLAEKEMDHVMVLIYDAPEQTTIPLSRRAEWIRRLHPGVEVIEGVGGPTVSGRSAEVMRVQEEYVQAMLDGRTVTHFYSSEFYGEHMSRALNAVDRRVDEPRLQVPVSGTRIRENSFAERRFIDPTVYRDLIIKVAILGAPSTGKTTLSSGLAKAFSTQWMPEYGREYWEANHVDRRLSSEQLVEIAREHIRREDTLLLDCDQFLFADTNALTTAVFARYYHGDVAPELARLADANSSRYDLFLVCDDNIPYDDTWDRSGEVNRRRMQMMILDDLKARNISFQLISGSREERIAQVAASLRDIWKLKP